LKHSIDILVFPHRFEPMIQKTSRKTRSGLVL